MLKGKPLSAAYAIEDASGVRPRTKDAVVWSEVVEGIRKKVSPEVIFWFEDLSIASQSDSSVTLCAKSPFEREWVRENFLDLISSTLFELHGKKYEIHLTSRDEPEPESEPQTQARDRRSIYTGTLIPSYTFERFVVGPSNQFAHAASIAVARNPGHSYNPLFIYGGVGLGKTHLINAIGNYVVKHRTTPQARVCCISAEHFTNQVINSIKTGRMEELRNRYRFGCDILMIDDIQFIAGKESTQEEFFHTFNTLYESKKQIVLTSDKTPKDMPQIEERLRSRFEWGIITDIQPPEIETKVAILENLAEERDISLPKSVALFIAENINSNIRELEGTLINISAYAKLLNSQITIDLARDVLKNIVKDLPSKAISIEAIQKQVAAFFGVKVQELKSDKKLKTIAIPRQIAMYLARRYTGSSFPEIGDKFGGKDHSTVIHAVRKIEAMIEADPSFKNTIKAIMAKIEEQKG